MRRGEVWWANLPPPIGPRPVVLLSRDAAYTVRQFVTVASVTTRIRSIRSEVLLGLEDGLRRRSAVNLDNINTIPKASLERRVASLSDEKLAAVDTAIHFAVALAE